MPRRLTLATLVLAPTALAALAMPHHAAAATHDQGGGAAECTIAISMSPVAPGVSYVPGQASYRMSGFTDCMSTDAQLTHGTFTGTGSGIVGCIGGFRDGTITISWNNGQTSVEHLQFGEFLYGGGAEGSVVSGEFAGDMVGMALERRSGGGEVRCVPGLQSYGMAGEMGILGSGGGSGSGGGNGGGSGSGDNANSGSNSGNAGGNGTTGPARASAAALTPATGAVKASASVPTTGTTLSPSIPATGAGAAGIVGGVGLLGLGAGLLTRLLSTH
jgi:hypothetical protein